MRSQNPGDGAAGGGIGLFAGKRVLIVEDEYFIADETRRALEDVHATVVGPASSVEAAMAYVDGETIDAAILDIRLEGGTVFPVADRLMTLDIPFVFATAYAAGALPDRYMGYHLCEKPAALAGIARALFGPAYPPH